MDRRAVILVWDKTRGPITTRRMRSVAMERSRRRRRGGDEDEFPGTDGESTDDEGTDDGLGVVKDDRRAVANQQQGSAGRKAAPRRNAGPQIVVSEEFAGPTVLFLATRNGRQEMDVASRAWVGRGTGRTKWARWGRQ